MASTFSPFAAGYRTHGGSGSGDFASSSPTFGPAADATSSPSPPSSPILGQGHDWTEGGRHAHVHSMMRSRTPPAFGGPSSPLGGAGSDDILEPPVFTLSSPSLQQGLPRAVPVATALGSPEHRTAFEFSSSYTSSSSSTAVSASEIASSSQTALAAAPSSAFTHPLSAHSKANALSAHPSLAKTFPHTKQPHPDSPGRKRGLKRPLPTSPEKPSHRALGAMPSFQPTSSGSVLGRRMRKSAAKLANALESDDDLALDSVPLAAHPASEDAHSRDGVFQSFFGDSSDSSDESWPDSSSPPRHTADVEVTIDVLPGDRILPAAMVVDLAVDLQTTPTAAGQASASTPKLSTPGAPSGDTASLGLGTAFELDARPAASTRIDNPYRKNLVRSFSRISSSGPPHPLSASYVPSPPSQSPAHSRPRLRSPTRASGGGAPSARSTPAAGGSPLVFQTDRYRPRTDPSTTPKQTEAAIWAQAANGVFEHCQTSIVLDGRGLSYIDPIVADLGKMVTLPPLRASPPRDAHNQKAPHRSSLDAGADSSAGQDQWIPSLNFGGLQLNLANNRLTVLPSALFQVENLRVLSLRANNLRFLPPAIAELSNLKELNIGGNQLEYLPAEIQQLRLTTFNYFPNPFLKPPKTLPCPKDVAHSSSKACIHQPRYRVRPTWEQLTLLVHKQAAGLACDLPGPRPLAQPASLRPKPSGLSLRPLLLSTRSFGQSFAPTESLRTPANPVPDDPLLRINADDSTPRAPGGATTSTSELPDGGPRMGPPPAPFRVSEQGPRFANPSSAAGPYRALHTPTRMDEGAAMDSLQLGAQQTPAGVQAVPLPPPDVNEAVPIPISRALGSRRAQALDRTLSERQVSEVLEATSGAGLMHSLPIHQARDLRPRQGPSAGSGSAQNGPEHASPAPVSILAPARASPTSNTPALTGPMQIENGRASYVAPIQSVERGEPPMLGELCFRLLLSPAAAADASATTAAPKPSSQPSPFRSDADATSRPQLVLDRWDREDLARVRHAQDSGPLRTLEAAHRSASRTWASAGADAEQETADKAQLSSSLAGEEDEDGDRTMIDEHAPAEVNAESRMAGSTGHRSLASVNPSDAALDANANPWFSRCPNPAHTETLRTGSTETQRDTTPTPTARGRMRSTSSSTTTSDWPIAPAHRHASPLFLRPAETRVEWVSHIAGIRVARASVNTSVVHIQGPVSVDGGQDAGSAEAAGAGQAVADDDCLPLVWRGCSRGCLAFLDR